MVSLVSSVTELIRLPISETRSTAAACGKVQTVQLQGSGSRRPTVAHGLGLFNTTQAVISPLTGPIQLVDRKLPKTDTDLSAPIYLLCYLHDKKAQLTQVLRATAPSFQDLGCSEMAISRHLDIIEPEIAPLDSTTPKTLA